MHADTPVGVAGGVASDGPAPSEASVAAEPFSTTGKLLPPLIGPPQRGTRVRTYFSGSTSFAVEFGDFGHGTSVWTNERGIEALIGELGAALARARIARDVANGVPGTYVPKPVTP
jgi:hypothetical protein